MPRIVVIHGCRTSARVAELPSQGGEQRGAVQLESRPGKPDVYSFWILGQPSDEKIAIGMVQILAWRFGKDPHDKAHEQTAKRVVRRMRATVAVGSLQKQ